MKKLMHGRKTWEARGRIKSEREREREREREGGRAGAALEKGRQ
jgi:hypothetical protein